LPSLCIAKFLNGHFFTRVSIYRHLSTWVCIRIMGFIHRSCFKNQEKANLSRTKAHEVGKIRLSVRAMFLGAHLMCKPQVHGFIRVVKISFQQGVVVIMILFLMVIRWKIKGLKVWILIDVKLMMKSASGLLVRHNDKSFTIQP